MVKTLEDIDKCRKMIERLDDLGIPKTTIRACYIWLQRESRKLGKKKSE